MKTKVDEKAIRDLLKVVPYTPRGVSKILDVLHRVLPLVEIGREEKAMRMAIRLELEKDTNQSETNLEITGQIIYRLIRELDNHIDKRAVVETSLATICDIEGKAEQLESMQLQVRDIFNSLDERTKALFEVYHQLTRVDGVTNTRFCDLLYDIDNDPALVEKLRDEPELVPLVDMYKMACDVIELCG